MTKPSSEALKRAWELVEQPVPRHELGPIIAKDLQELMDQQGWLRRVQTAEFEARVAEDHAKTCELGAREWKAKLDKAQAKLAWLIMTLRHDITITEDEDLTMIHVSVIEAALDEVEHG
jgi:hypothetical protein